MTTEEFFRWKAFNLIEPIGDDRLDIILAQLCSVIANTHGNRMGIDDFLLKWGDEAIKKLPQTPEEAAEAVKMVMDRLRYLQNLRMKRTAKKPTPGKHGRLGKLPNKTTGKPTGKPTARPAKERIPRSQR